jgi:hypothetical protein
LKVVIEYFLSMYINLSILCLYLKDLLKVNDLPYKVHYVIFLHYTTTKKPNMLFSFVTTKNKQPNDIELCNAKTKRTYVDFHCNKTNKITYNKSLYFVYVLVPWMLFSSCVVGTFLIATWMLPIYCILNVVACRIYYKKLIAMSCLPNNYVSSPK